MSAKPRHRVRFQHDSDLKSPLAAAEEALALIHSRDRSANIFTVIDNQGMTFEVDVYHKTVKPLGPQKAKNTVVVAVENGQLDIYAMAPDEVEVITVDYDVTPSGDNLEIVHRGSKYEVEVESITPRAATENDGPALFKFLESTYADYLADERGLAGDVLTNGTPEI